MKNGGDSIAHVEVKEDRMSRFQPAMSGIARRAAVAVLVAILGIGVLPVPAEAGSMSGPANVPAPAADPNLSPADSVNTFIGTQDQGNTFPGASAPFGMAQVSPTGSHFSGWQYDDGPIRGFGHSYLSGAGCWEQGGLLSALPTVGTVGEGLAFDTTDPGTFDHARYASQATHEGEVGTAGYYRTQLTSYGAIDVEATATTRVGVQRYTFSPTASANVFLNVGQANQTLRVRSSSITVVDDRTVVSEVRVQGFCSGRDFQYSTWFATRFDRPFASFGTWNEAGGSPGIASQPFGPGPRGAWLTFDTTEDSSVQLSTGLSFTGAAGALENLQAEGLDSSGDVLPFDDVRAATRAEWNEELGKATAFGGTADDQVTFTTALYHAFLQPVTATDVDGKYRGFDDRVHVADGWTYYQWLSLWDTYRTQNQLLAMLQPERATDIARTVLTIREQGGWLPRWAYANYETNVMTGDPVTPFLADLWRYGAVQGGVTLGPGDTLSGEPVELDEQLLLEAMLENVDTAPPADSPFAGRSAVDDYVELGYVPFDPNAPKKGMDTDERHAASATMEYAVGDCAASIVIGGLGDQADAARLAERARSWLGVWDPAASAGGVTGLPRARFADGDWAGTEVGFQEGTAWQYQWLAWQDAGALAEAMGGNAAATARLDSFFDMDRLRADPAGAASQSWVTGTLDYTRIEYNPNNEFNLHAPWMYNFFGEPSSASAVNRAAQTLYTNAPDGITGNDDLGAMSAWYVFSAIGIYPSVPGTGDLLLHAPRFPRVDLRLGAHTLTITADGADGSRLQYVDAAALDGTSHRENFVSWDALRDADALAFTLTDDAATTWGEAVAERPAAPCSSLDDQTPPAVTLATSDTEPENGWFRGPVVVTADAVDNVAGRLLVEMRVNNGDWAAKASVDLTTEGTFVVEARATDESGNVSPTAAVEVRIDFTAPETTATVLSRDNNSTTDVSDETVEVRFDAEDANSGVSLTQARIDNGAWMTVDAASLRIPASGVHAVAFRSIDVAGNVETESMVVVQPDSPTPSAPDVTPSMQPADTAEESSLAHTGAAVLDWKIAAALLVLGLGVLGFARLRRVRES